MMDKVITKGLGGNMINKIRVIVICSLLLGLFGCATSTIEGDGQKTTKSVSGTHTVHGSFYNFKWSEPPATKCENGRNLYRVRSHTNALYSIASILSIGLYVPQTMEWWCDGTPKQEVKEEVYHPAP